MATWGWEGVSVAPRCVSRDTKRDQRFSTAGAEVETVSHEIYGLKPVRNEKGMEDSDVRLEI
jgi:hypothetical protein